MRFTYTPNARSSDFVGGRIGDVFFPDLIKGRVKGHFRKIPGGKTIWIADYSNKRTKKMEGHEPHKLLHADEKSTTVSNAKGEAKTYSHKPYNELNEEDIHAHLNSAMTVDDELAFKLWKHKKGIKDFDQFLVDLVKDEKERAKELEIEPRFTNAAQARDYVFSSRELTGKELQKKQKTDHRADAGMKGIKQYTRELRDKYGHVTTPAKAYMHPEHKDISEYAQATAKNKEAHAHEHAEAKMMVEHSENAHKAAEKEIEQVEEADKLLPADCPMIHGLSKSTELFGHQAETIAKMGVLNKAIVDVDMGGGKGLILPADALNLMGQGKVKKPLIVCPGGKVLDQNASKIHDYTDAGVNVFIISNKTIREKYDGDVEKMVEAIHEAPPNTIFMASYEAFSKKNHDAPEGEEFEQARALGAAGFDLVSLDESQRIKNTNTDYFKSMKYLSKAKYRRIASGTFISNNPADSLGQLSFLHPQVGMDVEEFREKYGYVSDENGVNWTGLKSLRADLKAMGMISLRRSAWIDKLPKRDDGLSISKMDPKLKAVHETVLNDVVEQLHEMMAKSPTLKKFFDDDGLGDSDEEQLPPQALAKLALVSSIVDHPHEMSEIMEQKLETIKEARKTGQVDEETEALIEQLLKLSPDTRRAIRSLKGVVSPKAKDVYKKIEEHFKDKKNGKYIVFCQRKASANHIVDNMPPEMRKHAVYYDASKKAELEEYLKNPNGPKILVAVDRSIKEGVNMQVANGMYRYDHHWSPGDQEQSYARIWRFGQDKPTKITKGIVDGSIDVPKYARLMSKLHQNMQVTSDFEDNTLPAFRMGLETIQNKNNADMLPEYDELNKKIIDFQHQENVGLKKRFGTGMLKRSTGRPIGGEKAKMMHGLGPYQESIKAENLKALTPKENDALLGHFREQLVKMVGPDAIHNHHWTDQYFPDAYKLAVAEKARDPKSKELSDVTLQQHTNELEKNEQFNPREIKFLRTVVNGMLSGSKHKGHEAYGVDEPIKQALKAHGIKTKDANTIKQVKSDVQDLLKRLGNKDLVHLGEGKVENPELAQKEIADMEKKSGEKFSPRHKKVLLSAATMAQEISGGWEKVKHHFTHVTSHFEDEDEDGDVE